MIKRLFWLTLTIVLLSALFACAATAEDTYEICNAQGVPVDNPLYIAEGDSQSLCLYKDGEPIQDGVEWAATDDHISVVENGKVNGLSIHGFMDTLISPSSVTASVGEKQVASVDVLVAKAIWSLEFTPSIDPASVSPGSEVEIVVGTLTGATRIEGCSEEKYSELFTGTIPETFAVLYNDSPLDLSTRYDESENNISCSIKITPDYMPSQDYDIKWNTERLKQTGLLLFPLGNVDAFSPGGTDNPCFVYYTLDLGHKTIGTFRLDAQYAIWDSENSSVTALTMEVGDQSKQFALACNGAAIPEGVTVTWTANDNQYVEVDPLTGTITPKKAHAEGESTTITAATQDGGSASFAVTVAGPTGVDCQTAVSLVQGESVSFTAKALPEGLRRHGLSLANDAADAPLTISAPQVGSDGLHTWTLTAAEDAEPGEYTMTVTADADASVAKQIAVTVSEPAPPYVPPYVPPAPAAPSNIQFTPAEDLPAGLELKQGESITLELGVIDNYAAFAAAGVEVTAVPVCDAGLTLSASIGQEGRLTVHLSALESGEHQFTVTLSAPGCSAVNAAALAVRVPSPAPVEKKIVVEAQSGAYTGIKGVTHLMKKDGAVTFSVQGLEGVPGVTWKSSKPKRVAIDAVTGEATLKKTGSALITATLPGGGELTLKVKVNKGDFARPESIRLQTKAEGQWTDAPAQGITVVPNERGVKNVPTRLVGGGGKIVIESIQIDTDIATRDGGNPAPVKVKKRFLTDGKTTTLVIRANGREFTLPIAVNSSAKDLYPDEMMAQVQEILQLEED